MRKPREDYWATEEEQFLIQWWAHLSAREIGMKIKRKKNAVIGKARRLGLPLKKRPNKSQRPSGRAVTLIRAPKAVKPRAIAPTPLKVKKERVLPMPVPGGLHIMDLHDHHCRSIIGYGEDGLARYCGADVALRPMKYRGVSLITDAAGNPKMRALAWCEGHALIYLNDRA